MSIRRCFLILIMIVAFLDVLHAQDSLNYSTLSIAIGGVRIANKDLFQSPYTYKGTNLLLNASYERFGVKGQHRVDFTFSGGHMESVVSPQAKNHLFMLYYDYLFNFKTTAARRFSPSLGMGLHSLLSNTNYLPDIEAPKSYLSGGAFFTLSGALSVRLNERSNFIVRVGLPVFGLVYRPDFEINGNTLTEPSYIGKGGLFSFGAEYDFKLSRRLSLRVAYQYNYFAFDRPRSIDVGQSGLSVGIRRTF
jgi:hypothetical protein